MELAKVILEMPPVLEERKEREETIEEDPKLSDYDSHPHVFVDISMSVSNRVRLGHWAIVWTIAQYYVSCFWLQGCKMYAYARIRVG